MIEQCKICGLPDPGNKHFWREHRMSLSEYCLRHIARKDLHDGSPITWTGDLDSYLLQDFNSRATMKAALLSWPEDKARGWCLDAIRRRKAAKGVSRVPCEVELRSLTLPPTSFLDRIFAKDGGYHAAVSREIGLEPRFKEVIQKGFVFPDSTGEFKVVVDTREAKPLDFSGSVKIGKLDYGDYFCPSNPGVFFERKSLADLVGTMTAGFGRFNREIERAKSDKAYLVVLVESPINTALEFDKARFFSKTLKVTPKFVFHQIRAILQGHPNIQFLFLCGREEMVSTIKLLSRIGGAVRDIDLQHAKSLGVL